VSRSNTAHPGAAEYFQTFCVSRVAAGHTPALLAFLFAIPASYATLPPMRKFKSVVWGIVALSIFLCPALVKAQGTLKTPSTSLHCLWKAEGASNVVYLLGSIHLLRATNYPLAAVIEAAFTNSQIAVFETDIDKMEDPAQQMAMLGKISLPAGQTLRQNLSPEAYESFSNHAAQVGLPMVMLEQFRPAAAIMTLEVMQLMTLGVDPQAGVDSHFNKLARKDGKQVIPLETVDFQIGLLTNFTKEEEDLMVQKSLEEMDDEKKLYNEMVVAWQIGDSAALEKMLNKLRDEAPSIFKKLVSDRTASWVPQIEKLLHGSQNAVVIVGAGHLVGPDGAIELLKKKGIKVTQL
jgi:uncharacterized protein YbaP (TraB family)